MPWGRISKASLRCNLRERRHHVKLFFMQIYAERSDGFYCALFGPEDFSTFAATRTACWKDKKNDAKNPEQIDNLDEVLQAVEQVGDGYWSGIFKSPDNYFFILVKDGNEPEIIGLTEMYASPEKVSFETSHILSPYRRLGLSTLMYAARLKFALENSRTDMISLQIKPINGPSIEAAERNGFMKNGSRGEWLVFTRDISELRRAAPALQPANMT